MPNTYTELRRTVLGTATNSVTLSSIPANYTDLVLVIAALTASPTPGYGIRVGNGSVDSGSNYSYTRLYGNGSSASSDRAANVTDINGAWGLNSPSNMIVHIQNYSNTTTYKSFLTRINEAGAFVAAIASTWRSTSAIDTVNIFSTANYPVGTTFSLYGIANADQGAAKATGGIITEDSQYWYHTFGASGAFIPKQSLTCDVLVVAGGGGGGSLDGGGGGSGGLTYYASQSLTAISHLITVGAGGTGATTTTATQGVNSQFAALTASVGGGLGGGFNGTSAAGGIGGSGGGGGYNNDAGGIGTSGQGNNGGSGFVVPSIKAAGGGGGGFGATGTSATSSAAGNGGIGSSTYSSWLSATTLGVSGYIAAGGGGGGDNRGTTAGTGGTGGGGAGSVSATATAGQVNTGSGGGGGGYNGATQNGGAGGSGLVIIRYSK
jgi:hypothetical protein